MKTDYQPLSFKEADTKAAKIVSQMTVEEKISLVGGERIFFIRPMPRLHISEVFMADASQGIHNRDQFDDVDLSDYLMEKTTAFPCPVLLASSWNTELAYQYARAIGQECRIGGIGILLGPGVNIYRQAQCGRNFEYFGEDPFLAARITENYVRGLQSTGTVATLKHFVANNTDYYRRKSNSVVDERTLYEIYLPAFKAGIDAGARAVMTSYNLLNGEWCGQSKYVINDLLRSQLGFKWLVMTDWWSVYDGEKVIQSGMDLEMPYALALGETQILLKDGKISVTDIDRMARSILRTCISMDLIKRTKHRATTKVFEESKRIALHTAREGIVLLKNDDSFLPLGNHYHHIILTGDYIDKLAFGEGAARVEGYDNRLLIDELKAIFDDKILFINNPTVEDIRSAEAVICSVGTADSEGWDRPFELPDDQEKMVLRCVNNNPNTLVIVNSGGGIRMTDWNNKAKAVIIAWYGGQTGNTALAEIICGKINPSGKLPITIEKEFKDSPGYGYIPEGEKLYSGWNEEEESKRAVYNIEYSEGIFIGYRWYEHEDIEPLYPFGHGLSYSIFEYKDMQFSQFKFKKHEKVDIRFKLTNLSNRKGSETAQLYVRDVMCSIPRPVKELKGFKKINLDAGESKIIRFSLNQEAFSFWDPVSKSWSVEKGTFFIYIGSSSSDIRLQGEIELI